MGTNLMGELVANNGTYIVNTIFASIKTAGVDTKSTYIAAPATALKAGAIITPISDLQFSGVQLTSGSVALVLG
jgi:hypothetical protein